MENDVIKEYINEFDPEVQKKLNQIYKIIKENAPEATEKISYQMPTFFLNGNLVHFAAQKKHIGFYPSPSAIVKFEDKLQKYKYSKGAVQFPLNEELPEKLIKEMVIFRVKENTK